LFTGQYIIDPDPAPTGYIKYRNFEGSGEITFTKFSDGIASGTFWFDAITEDGSDTVRIREGRFDYDM
jgi:hypothetical protein